MADHYIYDLEDTWNDAGTTFFAISMDVTNTASANGSSLLWLGVGGTRMFAVGPRGEITQNPADSGLLNTMYGIRILGGNNETFRIGGALGLSSDVALYWTNQYNSADAGIADVGMIREAAGVIRVTNGGAGYGRLDMGQAKTTPVAFGSLPSAATVGSGTRAFISDALTPTFGATAVGGGAIASPVYSDGTTWKIG